MIKINSLEIRKAILLAPMEDVTDISFRLVCRELGADIVYTEFVNSEGLVRANEKTHKKLKIIEEERPVGIQIYGANIDSMVGAGKIAEAENPDLIDINAGCWVKNVVGCGAGSALLKDPPYMQQLVKAVVDSTSLPITVKTRLGWDEKSIQILEVAKRMEDAGAVALTVHCRTRKAGHKGEADWSWITQIKEVVNIPVILNGNVLTAQDVKNAFDETGADGIMIARGAIGNPWIFKEAKELLSVGKITTVVDEELRIKTCLRHLFLAIEVKGEKRAVLEHRKFYTGYLKSLYNASKVRSELMMYVEYAPVEELLLNYLSELKNHTLTV
ncbi:MAG: tRNA dihydrouridine synthase DusB [Ignavibacteria bacterium]|nr:tRNA dihydrouridine synthase DusB [Ignavibacteria bacterium]MBT8383673.1 tRNA dihydrouridine synthase DusB [Ignavibacteria bacterium]MBT8391703.1 tRNA dihydrouridine synthase DusB [Ignavibacteria bacterium]NNJ54245.1 tRNA dihydrouridine synthase DusB [Ignavibacteriaceae bacterium]